MRSELALLLALGAGGCTLLAGQPTSQLTLEVSFRLPGADAPMTTDQGFTVTIDRASVEVPGATLRTAAATTASGDFDPTNPPPGCTLCHGGHCHCGDRLVDYAELSGGGATAGASASYPGPVTVDARQGTVTTFPTHVVPEDAWSSLALSPPTLTVTGTVSGPGVNGERFVLVAHDVVSPQLAQQGDLALSAEREPDVTARLDVVFPERLLDGIAFGNLEVRDGARRIDRDFAAADVAALRETLSARTTGTLTVDRVDAPAFLPPPEPALPRREEFGL